MPGTRSSEPSTLAIESATGAASVALLRGERLVGELAVGPGRPASEILLPAIDTLLGLLGVPVASIEGFAVSIGPGSFTGLRVGLATVKGLAFDPVRPVAPVPTLAALAAGAGPGPDPIAALLDARRGEVYAAVYPGGPDATEPLIPDGVYRLEELADRLPDPCTVVGPGVAVAGALLRARRGRAVRLVPPTLAGPRAYHVGRLGVRALAAGRGRPAAELIPRYLRRTEAEVRGSGGRCERDGDGNRPAAL